MDSINVASKIRHVKVVPVRRLISIFEVSVSVASMTRHLTAIARPCFMVLAFVKTVMLFRVIGVRF